MSTTPGLLEIDVAVMLIARGDKLLAVYNEPWMSFTLPMTKRRLWQDPDSGPVGRREDWADAAARAAAQWLGRTLAPAPSTPLLDLPRYEQSDCDGVWTRYHFQVFGMVLKGQERVIPTAISEWLSPAQFLDENRRPLSATARYLIGQLQDRGSFEQFPSLLDGPNIAV